MGEKGAYKFFILKNHPEATHYEILKKKKGLLNSILEKIGLEKEIN